MEAILPWPQSLKVCNPVKPNIISVLSEKSLPLAEKRRSLLLVFLPMPNPDYYNIHFLVSCTEVEKDCVNMLFAEFPLR